MKKLFLNLLMLLSVFAMLASSPAMAQTAPPASPPTPSGNWWQAQSATPKKTLKQWEDFFSLPSQCWGCELFSKMAAVTLDVGQEGSKLFVPGAKKAITAFMGLWVVFQLWRMLSPSHANSPSQSIDQIFTKLVLMMILLFIMSADPFTYLMEPALNMIGGVMNSASTLIGGGGGGCSSSGGGPSGIGQFVNAGTSLMCKMHIEMGKGIGMGVFLIDSATISLFPPEVEIFRILGGIILVLAFGFMLVILPFRLFDALIRIATVAVILPVAVLAYQFKPTRGFSKQAATSVLAAGLTFLFTAIAIAISVRLIQEVAAPVLEPSQYTATDVNTGVGPLDGKQFMVLVAAAVGMAAFIMQAGSIAAEFAGFQGQMGGVGGAGAAAVGGAMIVATGAAGVAGGRGVSAMNAKGRNLMGPSGSAGGPAGGGGASSPRIPAGDAQL